MIDMTLLFIVVMFSGACGFMFKHFTNIYEAQFSLTDKLIAMVTVLDDKFKDLQGEEEEIDESLMRTHILGGLNVHGEGICSIECWCMEGSGLGFDITGTEFMQVEGEEE